METKNEMPLVSFISVHPGTVLADWLDDLNISQKDFAETIGVPTSRLNEIIKGKKAMTAEFAEKLVEPLGMGVDYWLRMQANYEYNEKMLALRELEDQKTDAEEETLRNLFNLKVLYKYLDIVVSKSTLRLSALFEALDTTFEELMTRPAIVGCFKHSDTLRVDEKNMRTWVVIAQCEAIKNKPQIEYLGVENAKTAAREIATLANIGTLTEDNIRSILANHGIAYSVVNKLDGCPIDAYSVMLDNTPAIVVTHRHNDMQKLIFDVLHELGHIILHMNKEHREFINIEYSHDNQCEREADEFARNTLIPSSVWADINKIQIRNVNINVIYKQIGLRAISLGINPHIAVARYKHDSKEYRGKVYGHTAIV